MYMLTLDNTQLGWSNSSGGVCRVNPFCPTYTTVVPLFVLLFMSLSKPSAIRTVTFLSKLHSKITIEFGSKLGLFRL